MENEARVKAYRKNPNREAELQQLQVHLRPVEISLYQASEELKHPIIFIVGVGRSGTTLVSQLLSQCGDFGYISNFLACFWEAPALGALIQKVTGAADRLEPDEYASDYGVTRGWAQPHEWGYFWNRWFDFGQDTHHLSPDLLKRVDREGMVRELGALERVLGKPLVFKNPSWHSLQIEFLAGVFPRAVFVVCRRHPLFLAQSHLVARLERFGKPEAWWSIRPREYAQLRALPVWDQVMGQVFHIEREMDRQLANLAPQQVVEARYESVCRQPARFVREVSQAVFKDKEAQPAPSISSLHLQPRHNIKTTENDWQRLLEAYQTWYGRHYQNPEDY